MKKGKLSSQKLFSTRSAPNNLEDTAIWSYLEHFSNTKVLERSQVIIYFSVRAFDYSYISAHETTLCAPSSCFPTNFRFCLSFNIHRGEAALRSQDSHWVLKIANQVGSCMSQISRTFVMKTRGCTSKQPVGGVHTSTRHSWKLIQPSCKWWQASQNHLLKSRFSDFCLHVTFFERVCQAN